MIIRVGVVQMACSADPEENLFKAITRIREAAERGAQIVCLPELFRSRYFCQTEEHANFALAEEVPGPTSRQLGMLARECGVALVVPLFERRAPGLYHNTAAVIDADGRSLGKYRKMHIPDDPQFHEKFYFAPGDLGFAAWQTRYGQIGVLICWDQWYPEAARLTALQGAGILFYPTAIGWLPSEKEEFGDSQHAAWQTIQRSHAIANGVFVVSVNRVGLEAAGDTAIDFWGGSFVCNPRGQILAAARHDGEAVLVVQCDLGEVEIVRTHWPFLRDRRLDAYSGLTQRYLD